MRIVGGRHRGTKLLAPPGRELRPTAERTREALFDILTHGERPLAGGRFLDLFAGTGAVGLEAWSRGAAEVVLVENDPSALAVIRRNLDALGRPDDITLLARDATKLGRAAVGFDVVFLDPPYRSDLAEPALESLENSGWLGEDARIVLELAAKEPLRPPPGFELLDERRYGAARLVFLRPTPG